MEVSSYSVSSIALANRSSFFPRKPHHGPFKIGLPAVPPIRKALPRALMAQGQRPYTSVMIVPTGVGVAIGGFAGDALPVARAMASVVDCLISHPNVEKWVDAQTGQSTGRLGYPDSLLRAVDTLVNRANVNAIAVVGRFPDDSLDELEDYRQGKGVDVLAGVEAIISHLIVQEFHIPCAHAPALLPLPLDPLISPRSAAEEIGYTFLPCVLAGLSRAPQYVVQKEESPHKVSRHSCIWASDVDSVVVPIDACGGAGTLAFGKKAGSMPLMIAVEENETVLNDTPEKLELNVVRVANYWEALGVIAAHKSGIDPQSLRRDGVKHIKCSLSLSRRDSFPNYRLQNSRAITSLN